MKIKITTIVACGFGLLMVLILLGGVNNYREIKKVESAQNDIFLSTGQLYKAASKERHTSEGAFLAEKWQALVMEEMLALVLYMDMEADDEEDKRATYKRLAQLNHDIIGIGEEISGLELSEKIGEQVGTIQEKQKVIKETAIDVITAFDSEGEVGGETRAIVTIFRARYDALAREIKELQEMIKEDAAIQNRLQSAAFSEVQNKVGRSVTISNDTVNMNVMTASLIIVLSAIIALFNHKKLDGYSHHLEESVEKRTQELKTALHDLEQSQDRLIQVEKMAALGQLVAGVAHEINTPLGVSVTATSHLTRETSNIISAFENRTVRKEDFEEYFREATEAGRLILSNLNRASDLIKSFKMVSADQSSQERREFHVDAYLKDILLSLKPQLKKVSHEIKIRCPEDVKIDSYPGAFSQVVTNLLMNSLTHAFDPDDKGLISIDVSDNDQSLTMIFADNGKGIAENNLKKIFDPFFTTNRASGNTGLGLHIIHNIVHETMKGTIICDSIEEQGTRFTVTLPVKV